MKKNKVLIIRFSSFGDIVQCSPVLDVIGRGWGTDQVEIHWATRSDFEFLVKLNKNIDRVWSFDKKLGFLGLVRFALKLRKENYSHIYDAHNNLRSALLKIILLTRINVPALKVRSKDRVKRFLLFKLRINLLPNPFKGIRSFILPLRFWFDSFPPGPYKVDWNFPDQSIQKIENYLQMVVGDESFICLVPSAAWTMKRWPLDHWKKLIGLLPNEKFMVLGGAEDTFCQDLVEIDPKRVFNLSGQLSLVESSCLLAKSKLIISADTGLLHVADVLGVKGIALMGPTAFGFTTSQKIKIMQIELACRPCTKDGRGRCSHQEYQACMVYITPTMVANEVQLLIHD